MKKLIAILLSALMLCTVIPFATVSAADEPTIVVSTDAEEYNAGDEIEVTVELQNNPGVIAATVEILYDHDALELVTYFDEDEEMWLPQIEVGTTFSASSNKYITFGPIDDETGVAKKCVVSYIRGTAKSNCDKELFFTATFKVKDTAVSGNYDLTISYDPANFFNVDMVDVYFGKQDTSIVINGSDPLPPACEHEYEYDCSKNCSKCGEETRPEAEHEYFYACDPVCMICYEMTNPEAAHSLTHVEAVEPTCTENGNIEYWACDACGTCWDNENAIGMPLNRFNVILPATGHTYFNDCSAICETCGYEREVSHNVIYVEAVAPTCTTDGNIEYWYCDVCGAAWLDEACILPTNLFSVILPASCSYNAIHNEGIEAGCHYTGWTENWYCANCDVYYLDAACATITNYKSLTIPALQDSAEYVPAKAPTCTENGNVEYWVCYECEQIWGDVSLIQLTNFKNVQIAPSCSYNAIHNEGIEAGCHYTGRVENWYCANCDVYYLDAECTVITNYKSLTIPALQDSAEYVAAKAPTCIENGNVEYWVCYECEQIWADAALTQLTNFKNVQIGTVDHTYTNAHDAFCDVCNAERDIIPSADEIILFGGSSVSEQRTGLAFKFDAAISGLTADEECVADYANATVIIDGVEYKLIGMGAIANNQGQYGLELDAVDGVKILNIAAEKIFNVEADSACFAIRIINIPEANLDTTIIARPYYVYENAEGVQITIYGEDVANSYNGALNG